MPLYSLPVAGGSIAIPNSSDTLAILSFPLLIISSGLVFRKALDLIIISMIILLTLVLTTTNFDFLFIRAAGSYFGFFIALIVSIIYFERFGIPVKTIEEAESAAKIFLERGVKNAVITLGELGVYVLNSDINQHIPSFDMGEKVIDTTGAGDAFNGGFTYALAEGLSIIEAIRFGSATAALSVTRTGTAPAMPFQNEIKELLNK